MKKTIKFLATSCTFVLVSCASEFKIPAADVPQAVMTAFQSKYPNIQSAEWEAEKAEGHLTFEAEFKVDGKKKEAVFKPDGTFIKEE